MQKLELIVEHGDGYYWGYIDNDALLFQPNGHGSTLEAMIENVKVVIKGYQANEGQSDEYWKQIDIDALEFDLKVVGG